MTGNAPPQKARKPRSSVEGCALQHDGFSIMIQARTRTLKSPAGSESATAAAPAEVRLSRIREGDKRAAKHYGVFHDQTPNA
jgi:hypothetical protein